MFATLRTTTDFDELLELEALEVKQGRLFVREWAHARKPLDAQAMQARGFTFVSPRSYSIILARVVQFVVAEDGEELD